MYNILVEKAHNSRMHLEQMSIRRDWMDQTSEKHAYRCHPVTQANVIGWNISCLDDISFIWDGINDQTSNHIKILQGESICNSGRGQSSLSFTTGLIFKTNMNISIFTINPVNYFNEDFETMSSLVSTSFPDLVFPLAIKARSANKEILIKAGTPLATIIPISLSDLNNSNIEIIKYEDPNYERGRRQSEYGDAAQALNKAGEWTDWYRNGVNEKGEVIGSHEVKNLRLYVTDNTQESLG